MFASYSGMAKLAERKLVVAGVSHQNQFKTTASRERVLTSAFLIMGDAPLEYSD
jgi:phosphoribosyl 1,2-cyclic phosphodiesterase